MKNNILLETETAYSLYDSIRQLPVIDYHCHLDPKEIYEDLTFGSIGEIWLRSDHYKWRLMRACGIDEKYITGDASWYDKFTHFVKALSLSPGNPLYYWSSAELSSYFGIELAINENNARLIWDSVAERIASGLLSPRKILQISNVKTLCTTDDICDPLKYHKLLADSGMKPKLLPTFRTDKLFFINTPVYREYIKTLEHITGMEICDLASLKSAISSRLSFFKTAGARFADIGIEYFPETVFSDDLAESVFTKALFGKKCTYNEINGFSGNLLAWLNRLYAKENIISQLHVSVKRNANHKMYDNLGPDIGTDCIADDFKVQSLINLFNAVGDMPKTIVYMLDSAHIPAVVSACGSFPNVRFGAAWWFCDNRRGIENVLSSISEISSLGSFLGMLTDSRSFLSLSRHDFFRRILCNYVAKLVDSGEFPDIENAQRVCFDVSYNNINNLINM